MSDDALQAHPAVTTRAWRRVLTGCLLGIVALWLALRGTDAGLLWRTIEQSRPLWVLTALGSVGVTLAVVVFRWRLLLQHPEGPGLWLTLFQAAIVGQMLNVLLPIRLGELARAFLVSRSLGIPVARVFTTIAVERLGDMVAIGLAAAWMVAFVSLPGWVQRPAGALVMAGIAAAIGAALLSKRAEAFIWLMRLAARAAPSAWRPWVEKRIGSVLEGLGGLRTWQGSVSLGVLSVAVLLLAASTNLLLFRAFDLQVPATAAVVLLIALQVGNTIVSVPGNLGVFHYVTILVLSTYGVERGTAVAYAIVLYAVALLPKIALGVLIMAAGPVGFSFQAVRDLARRGN